MKSSDSLITKLALAAYRSAKKHHLLDTKIGSAIFQQAYFLYKKYYEDNFAALLKKHPELLGQGNVIDVGANIGYTSLLFSRYLAPDTTVLSIEPENWNFEVLERTARKRKINHIVTPIKIAAGNTCGKASLKISHYHHADHKIDPIVSGTEFAQSIAMDTLDQISSKQLAGQKISFVKIDTQGYEWEICKGMQKILKMNENIVVALEVDFSTIDAYSNSQKIIDYFTALKFETFKIESNGCLTPFAAISKAPDIDSSIYFDLLFKRKTQVQPSH